MMAKAIRKDTAAYASLLSSLVKEHASFDATDKNRPPQNSLCSRPKSGPTARFLRKIWAPFASAAASMGGL
jgi:hypothetical protein